MYDLLISLGQGPVLETITSLVGKFTNYFRTEKDM